MRHTPCGCAPYGEGAFHIRRARPLGVPSAKRQTVQGNRFVHSRQFLHRRAESLAQPLPTKERYGCGIALTGARPTTVATAESTGGLLLPLRSRRWDAHCL